MRYKLITILPTLLISLALFSSNLSHANDELNELDALPELGDPSQQALPLQQEKAMGQALVAYLKHNALLVEDPDLRSYLDSLTNRLIGWVKMPYPLSFYILNDPSINAFAAPGGIIVLHTGLIIASQTESELASVVAHEMAHISQRHAARNYALAQKLSLPTAAAMLAAILIGSQDPAAAQAAIVGVQAGSIQNQLNYSRRHEREADSIGMQILHQANIDATGMSDFFLRLQQQSRYSGNQPPPFLSTHPVTDERIANAQDRNRHQRGQGQRDSLGFHLAQVKLLTTYTTNPQQTLLQLRQQDSRNPLTKNAARYGQALLLQKTGRYAQARSILSALVKKYPDEITFILALARVETEDNNPQQALNYYQSTYDTFFNNPVLILDYSRLLSQQGQFKKAQSLLKPLTQQVSAYQTDAWYLLADTLYQAGNTAIAKEAMAEYFLLNGNISAAIGQLEQALESRNLHLTDRERMTAQLFDLRKSRPHPDD